MLFNSLPFVIFLVIVWVIYWTIPEKWRKYFLLLASIYFYACFEWWYVFLLLLTTIIDFWAVQQILKHPQNKKLFLWISISMNLLILGIFKYGNFFVSIFQNTDWTYQWAIPVGLSFYTFQSMSYVIDVYRSKYRPDDTFAEFLLYVSFFPHMVAGPVVRYYSLMPQLKKITYFKDIQWWDALRWCVWGYFKKMVIADNLDYIVTPAYQHIAELNGWETILAGFLFAVQVYCDFSGYSDIATGIAKLFNVNLSINWIRPFLSKSIKEFWSRNHISVTTWFRDYLYISLGGNRVSTKRWILNIFLTFVISGFWHGANYTFIIWGAFHGIFFLLEHFFWINSKWIKTIFGNVYLLLFHSISMLAFRCPDISSLSNAYSNFFQDWSFHFKNISNYNDKVFWYFGWLMVIFLFMKEISEETNNVQILKLKNYFREAFYVILIIGIFVFGNFHSKPFIYFQF
ncbi:MAG TPA: MBOAT family O-acyltransferase [Bacteroidia bacterium]|nr:MBOAT family O-acyltransferase [Bacteroidia bacterium]